MYMFMLGHWLKRKGLYRLRVVIRKGFFLLFLPSLLTFFHFHVFSYFFVLFHFCSLSFGAFSSAIRIFFFPSLFLFFLLSVLINFSWIVFPDRPLRHAPLSADSCLGSFVIPRIKKTPSSETCDVQACDWSRVSF